MEAVDEKLTIIEESVPASRGHFRDVCEILARYQHNPAKLIPILQDVQQRYRYLPEEVLTFVATSLDVPPASVYGVATFYSHFSLKPSGKYTIRLCDGTACHVRKSIPDPRRYSQAAGPGRFEENDRRHALYGGDRFLPGRLRPGAGCDDQRRRSRIDDTGKGC